MNSKGSANNIGAVVGVTRGSITNCYYLKDSGPNVNHYTYVEVAAAAELEAAVLGPSFMADTDHINNGFPILTWQERVPDVIISTYEQLKAFADSVNSGNDYEGKLVRLEVNVSLGGKASVWTPIGTGQKSF